MAKSKHVESEAQRKLEHGEVQCMELSWYETLAVLVILIQVKRMGTECGSIALQLQDLVRGGLRMFMTS